jgi:CotS family spore coat protein
MKPNTAEILKQYPLVVRNIRLLSWKGKKGAWAVQTDRGMKVLKKSPASKTRQMFLNQAVRHLQSNGALIPKLVQTRSGTDIAEFKGNCYVLSDAVKGSSPEYDTSAQLQKIMKTLGSFHLSSRGFVSKGQVNERMHLGRWEDGYVQHLKNLETFKEQALRESSSFSRLYLKHADTFIRHGKEAQRSIQNGAYSQWVSKVKSQKNLCHQDFAAGNLIRTSKGMYVIDMDSLTYDLPARDLRKILNKVMKKKGWNLDRTIAMLRAYQSVHPLSKGEYSVLKADLLFPHLFYGISNKYFKRRTDAEWNKNKTVEKLSAMIRSESSKMNVLNKWDLVVQRVMEKRS